MLKVSAIVVTYNRLNLLKKCLKNLLSQTYSLNNIIIINNKSTDGTFKYLRRLHNNKIIVKTMSRNVGGAGGFSEGLKLAYNQTTSDLFWIMDDDTMPTQNSLSKLVDSTYKLHNHFGFICSNVRWWKNKFPCNIPTVSDDWDKLLPSNLIKIKKATFVSFMISRKVISRMGLPIASMFIWGDDVEYSLRLSNEYPCYFVSNSIVIHDTKATAKDPTKPALFNIPKNREKFLEYSFRNELYAARKHENDKKLLKKIVKDLYFIIRIPFLSDHDRLKKMYYTISGFIKGFAFNPKIEFPNNKK